MSTSSNRRDFLKTLSVAGAGLTAASLATRQTRAAVSPQTGKSVMGLVVDPLETVRVAFIGVGSRGGGHVGRMLKVEGVEITAICDSHAPAAEGARARCVKAGHPEPRLYVGSDTVYREMLECDDIDVVLIATPWKWHTPQCIHAMESGKHALVEVPAAVTVEECWQLVDTAERTQKNCMMLENVNYGRDELMVLNMCRQGLFGDLLHGEAAYIHDLRFQMKSVERGTGSWRTHQYIKRNGNLYPTHGLGPIAQYMNINRGDRFDYLSSVSSPALGRAAYAADKFPPNHKWNQVKKWNCGDMNTTMIKTALGRSIMVQWDETSPRPYDRLNLIQGTKGTFAGYPNRIVVEGRGSTHRWTQGAGLQPYYEEFDHPLWKRWGAEAKKVGGHGGMDALMLWRLIYCLRNGEPLDQDVYDAAAWSVIGPLSEKSVADRSNSVDVPDFTRGAWKTGKPLGIVS
ncbi:MAG: Gfo/Idh/MocA family oxidoreductase [Verrucomicrobia bacterium]|jgi:predicted dehydrogenase|nr:Gfo/Idh/MocA family oxidoreductase [Verrucomicrobiota bacterium]